MMRTFVTKSDDEAESPTSACLLDTAATDPLWTVLPPSSPDPLSGLDKSDRQCYASLPSELFWTCESPHHMSFLSRSFDPCGRSQQLQRGRLFSLTVGVMNDSALARLSHGVLACLLVKSTLADADSMLHGGAQPSDAAASAVAGSLRCSCVRLPSPSTPAGSNCETYSPRSPVDAKQDIKDSCASSSAGGLSQEASDGKFGEAGHAKSSPVQQSSFSSDGPSQSKALQNPSWSTSPVPQVDRFPDGLCVDAAASAPRGPITPEIEEWAQEHARGHIGHLQPAHDIDSPRTARNGPRSTAGSSSAEFPRISEPRPCCSTTSPNVVSTTDAIAGSLDVASFTATTSPLLAGTLTVSVSIDAPGHCSDSRSWPKSSNQTPNTTAVFSGRPEEQDRDLQRTSGRLNVCDSDESMRMEAPATSADDLLPIGPVGTDDGDNYAADDTEVESAPLPVAGVPDEPAVPQVASVAEAVRELHPDVPLCSAAGRATPQLAQLDQHLLDRVLLKVAAGGTCGALNAAAGSCRRLRNAVRRIAGTAGPPTLDSAPPVDAATAALDIRALHSFPSLHTLRLPKLDRGAPMLSVDLFRLRHLTLLTHLDVACAAAVPSFQPLRLLPNLRKLSVSGVTLAPPPDIPDISGCEVTLYANRSLAAATRGNVLALLPPLAGAHPWPAPQSCCVTLNLKAS